MTREEFEYSFGKTEFSTENWRGPRYRYGARSRPFGMGCQPRGFLVGALDGEYRDHERRVRWGWIEYPFQLTEEEVSNFELVDLTAYSL